MTKENINFRRICFQSIDLCCWWHVVHLVTVHENLANHMVLTGPALFIYCLASKDSWKCMKQEWQVAVIGKWMGRNSGQQFNSSYFISNENFYKSYAKSLQFFLLSFFHKDDNHLDVLYICFSVSFESQEILHH